MKKRGKKKATLSGVAGFAFGAFASQSINPIYGVKKKNKKPTNNRWAIYL